jgi:hypothetical protein
MKTLTVVGCGGTGSKFAERYIGKKSKQGEGFASVEVKILDSAKSDRRLDNGMYTEENTWSFKGMDGSGAFRSENAEAFVKELPSIMHWIGGQDSYVVISSASGGTGSVLSVLITEQLLREGKQVVAIVVGSYEDKQACVNTRNTLYSFANIADNCEVPVVMHYLNNHHGGEALSDDMATRALMIMSVLFSGENQRIDTMDLNNWLSCKTTTITPKLCRLDIHTGEIPSKRDLEYISVATLARENGPRNIGIMPEYSRTGFVPDTFGIPEEDIVPFPISLCIADGGFSEIIEELNDTIAEFEKAKVARLNRGIEVKKDSAVLKTTGSLVL